MAKKGQEQHIGYVAPKSLRGSLPDSLFDLPDYETLISKFNQKLVDEWGARRRAELSDMEAVRNMTETKLKPKSNFDDKYAGIDYALGWGKVGRR